VLYNYTTKHGEKYIKWKYVKNGHGFHGTVWELRVTNCGSVSKTCTAFTKSRWQNFWFSGAALRLHRRECDRRTVSCSNSVDMTVFKLALFNRHCVLTS